MQAKKLIGNLLLLLTAIIWGSGFVAQRAGMEFVGPLTFGASRFWLAFIVLIPVVHFMNKMDRKALAASGKPAPVKSPEEIAKSKKTFWTASILCGTMLFCGSILQQFGMVFTTAGKAAFITALYILLVPVFSLVLKHRPALQSWIGVACGTVGLYLLCITESFTIAMGDFIVLIGAVFWACHVLFIDHFLPYVNPAKLAMTQFGICAMYSTVGMLIFERQPGSYRNLRSPDPLCGNHVRRNGLYASDLWPKIYFSDRSVSAFKHGSSFRSDIRLSSFTRSHVQPRINRCILMFGAIIISQLPDKKSGAKEAQQ